MRGKRSSTTQIPTLKLESRPSADRQHWAKNLFDFTSPPPAPSTSKPVKPFMQDAIQLLSSEKAEKLDFDWGGLTWYASGSLGNSSELTVGSCRLNPGCSNPRHYHPNCSEILVVIQGNILHTMADGTESEMKPGDTVTVPPNVWHRATNIGQSEALLFIVFSSADRQVVGE
jgi:quercetin dioxygenase-like cupin family protein